MRPADDVPGDAAHQEAHHRPVPVGADGDHPCVVVAGETADGLGGVAREEVGLDGDAGCRSELDRLRERRLRMVALGVQQGLEQRLGAVEPDAVEGAGGLLVPITKTYLMADLARDLGAR